MAECSTIQRDPTRCWVRIDSEDQAGAATYQRTLIGDAWRLEPYGSGTEADEFSLTIKVETLLDRVISSFPERPVSTGMRLDRESGTALRDALNEWLSRADRTDAAVEDAAAASHVGAMTTTTTSDGERRR